MLRNREMKVFLAFLIFLSLGSLTISAFYSPGLALFLTVIFAVIIASFLLFMKYRYKRIEQLSSYLRQISSGNFKLDVRDNEEGELSILKNEIYKVTQKLSEQSQILEEDKKKLTKAISDISHQLKTPLTSMLVMADLLGEENLPEARRVQFTKKMTMQMERMEWLVSALLKLAKIDSGTAQFKKETIKIRRLMEKAAEAIHVPADLKEQQISINGSDGTSFKGDFNWTLEAMINILKNSVEHTPKGGRLEIAFAENQLFTEITISDNGIGIAKEDLPYVFKRFYKGKNSGEDSVGIGLAMAHSIITEQNGDIEVESAEGTGTTFKIKFYKGIL